MAPTDEMSLRPSVMLRHVWPPFVVFHTPPLTAPNQNTRASAGSPATATARPPRNGPTSRHRIAFRRADVADGSVYSALEYAAPPGSVRAFVGATPSRGRWAPAGALVRARHATASSRGRRDIEWHSESGWGCIVR